MTHGFFVLLDLLDLLLLDILGLASVMAGSVELSVEDCFDGAFVIGSDVFLDVLLGRDVGYSSMLDDDGDAVDTGSSNMGGHSWRLRPSSWQTQFWSALGVYAGWLQQVSSSIRLHEVSVLAI